MVEKLVLDVQLILELAILSHVPPTANGLHGMLGVSALPLVVEESKTEHEPFYKQLQTEAKNAKDQLLNSGIATPQNAQSTANGVHGANGMSAHEHVAEECKQEAEPLLSKKDTEESLAKEIHKKCKDVTCKLVQFARIAPDMLDSAHPGPSIAATASLSRDVVRSPADCAKSLPRLCDK